MPEVGDRAGIQIQIFQTSKPVFLTTTLIFPLASSPWFSEYGPWASSITTVTEHKGMFSGPTPDALNQKP